MSENNTEVVEKSEDELFNEALLSELKGEEPPVEEPKPIVDSEPAIEVEEPEAGEPEPIANARTEIIPGYTADELANALGGIGKLQKAIDTTNGTYGQKLAQLTVAVEQLLKKAEVQPKLVMPKLKLDKLKEAEYTELAELLENSFDESFREVTEVPQPKAEIDISQYEEKLQARISEFEAAQRKREQELELKLLKKAHPDFAEVAGYSVNELGMVVWNNLDFGVWAASALNADDQKGLLTSDDAGFLSDVLTRYKESKEAAQAAEETPAPKNKEAAIMTNAIKPKGLPVTTRNGGKTDEELFQEALYKELRS